MRTVLITSLLFGWAATAAAGDVTLQDAMRAAVTNRPAVKAARAEVEAASAASDEARSGWLPHLTLHERYTRTDEPAGSLFLALNQERNVMADPGYDLVDPAARDDFETRIQLTQTLYDPKIDYNLRRALTNRHATAAEAAWTHEEVAFAAFRAYLGVQQALAALDWVAASRREAEEIVRLAAERRLAGTGLKADDLRASVQLAEAKRRELSARNDLTLARCRLALAMGATDGEAGIAAPLTEKDLPAADPYLSVEDRADLRSLALQSQVAGLASDESRADWLPRLDVQAHYAWHDENALFGTDSGGWAVVAGLNWELFDGLRRSATTARTIAEQRAAEARLDDSRHEQNFLLTEARLRAEEARLQHESARQAVVEATEGQRLFQQRYEAGLADLADLLAAQSALDRARFDAVAAESRHLLTLGNVQFQGGRFLATFLPEKESSR